MNCTECQNLLAEFAIDMLEPEAQRQVAAHLSNGCEPNGCKRCKQQLKEMNDTWAAMPSVLSAAIPPEAIRQDLFARVRGDALPVLTPEAESTLVVSQRSVSQRSVSQRSESQSAKSWRAFVPYVAASLVGMLAGYWLVGGEGLVGDGMSSTDLAKQYESRVTESQRLFGKEQVYLATLQFSGKQPGRRGHLIWDGAVDQLHCYAFDLGELDEGSVFRLWFVTSAEEWHVVGDLEAQSDGVCTTVVPRPKLAKKWSRAVVTMEPESPIVSATKPHGPIRLSGDFR